MVPVEGLRGGVSSPTMEAGHAAKENRNGRRMISDFVLTEAHVRKANPEPVIDSVGLIWWPPDLHHACRIVKDGAGLEQSVPSSTNPVKLIRGSPAAFPLPLSHFRRRR